MWVLCPGLTLNPDYVSLVPHWGSGSAGRAAPPGGLWGQSHLAAVSLFRQFGVSLCFLNTISAGDELIFVDFAWATSSSTVPVWWMTPWQPRDSAAAQSESIGFFQQQQQPRAALKNDTDVHLLFKDTLISQQSVSEVAFGLGSR